MKNVSVVEKMSVRMFNVRITEGQSQMDYQVTYYNNEVQDIRDQSGEYISCWSDDDEDGEKPYSDEWMEVENIVNELIKKSQ